MRVMRIVDIITRKRDGHELSTDDIRWFIQRYTDELVTDYQAAALMMAIYLRGMTPRETVDLTLAMARSGDWVDLHHVVPYAVDKHSSGGVGDKTSLVVLPLVAACGVPVAKMSGRGLGFSGGTLDKMESITGWSPSVPISRFREQIEEIGFVLAGQTGNLAPADGKLYALRDVTATVSSIPLIAASIMSKKLAAGADGIVLDVKVGSGAFMKSVDQARQLAQTMVGIGRDAGRDTVALLANMNQPLGYAIGNSLETAEAIRTLQNDPDTPPDFWHHCQEIAAHMILLAKAADTIDQAKQRVIQVRDSGHGLEKFRAMTVAQGGDGALIDDPSRFEPAPIVKTLVATHSGYINQIDTDQIGWTCVRMGGGRAEKSDHIDPSVGLIIRLKVGDYVNQGDPLAVIHARTVETQADAEIALQSAIHIGNEPTTPLPQFYGVVQ